MKKSGSTLQKAAYALLLVVAMGALLLLPGVTARAISSGLRLCGTVIIPALFPFFVCTNLLISLRLTAPLERLLQPVMQPLFGVGGAGAAALVLGLVGGYPAGTQVAVSLYRSGAVAKQEAEQLLLFSNNAGPAFIFGVLAAGIFDSPAAGALLYATHIAAALAVGLLLRKSIMSTNHSATRAAAPRVPGFASAFTASVRQAGGAILQICMFILCFSVLAALLHWLLQGILPPALLPLLIGLLELSNGAAALVGCGLSFPLQLTLVAFLLGFAGLSICAQVQSLLADTDLSAKGYLPAKLLHGALASALTYPLSFLLFPESKAVAAFSTASNGVSVLQIVCLTITGTICVLYLKVIAGNFLRKRV